MPFTPTPVLGSKGPGEREKRGTGKSVGLTGDPLCVLPAWTCPERGLQACDSSALSFSSRPNSPLQNPHRVAGAPLQPHTVKARQLVMSLNSCKAVTTQAPSSWFCTVVYSGLNDSPQSDMAAC